MPLRMSALNRKLVRDLLEMKAQALAIAMVVAAGVSMYRDVSVEFRVAAGHARGLLQPAALRRRVRVAEARAGAGRRRYCRASGRDGDRDARRGQRHARSAAARRAGVGPPRVDPCRSPAACQRPLSSSRPMDRGWPAGRGAGERRLRDRTWPEPGRSDPGSDQRPPAPAHHRRRCAVAGVHLQHSSGRAGAGRQAFRHLLDGSPGARRRVRHGRRVQRRRAETRAGNVIRRGHRPTRSHARAVRRARRHPAGPAALALDGGERARPARRASVSCCRSSSCWWPPSSSTSP